MHIKSRLEYRTYVHGNSDATARLAKDERAFHNATARLSHATSLFWAIGQIQVIDFNGNCDPEANTHLRNLGELGGLICDGAIGDVSLMEDVIEDITTFSDVKALN